jgi:hypothetical protein
MRQDTGQLNREKCFEKKFCRRLFCFYENPYFCNPADVAKLADALDLGSSAARHVGSTPIIRTNGFFIGKAVFLSPVKSLFFLQIKILLLTRR